MKKALKIIKQSDYEAPPRQGEGDIFSSISAERNPPKEDNLTIAMRKSRGYALIIVIIIILVLALLSSLLISMVLSEFKISKSQEAGTGAFYVASSGTEEAIWLVQNNETYKTNLEEGTFDASNGDFGHDPAFDNTRYNVSIRSTDRGQADVTSTGYYTLGSQTSRRIVKTKIFKAINPNPIADNNIFTADDIDFIMSIVNINGGGLFSNEDIDIPGPFTRVTVEGDASAVDRINANWPGTLTAAALHATNYPPAPDPIDFPMVDFNDYYDKADAIYTKDEFEDIMWANQNLVINDDITYITMAPTNTLKIRGNQSITINGLLVIDGNIDVGSQFCWNGGPGPRRCGFSNITVNHTEGKPSGIIVKGDVEFSIWTGAVNIEGLLYGMDDLILTSLPYEFNVVGGFIGRRFFCVSVWQTINITYDEDIIRTGLGTPTFSPVVQIEHWEEQY